MENKKIKVLMVGPARSVKGGMTTVVNNYYSSGLDKMVDLRYIESINDKCIVSKFLKEKYGFQQFKKAVADCDIVHIHMASRRSTFRKIKYLQIAKKHKKNVIIHIHGGGFKDFFEKEKSARKRKFIINNLNKADAIIVLSEVWQSYFSKLLTTKVEVLSNAVKIPNSIEKKENDDLLFLGRLVKEKGIYDLLSIMPGIIIENPDVRLYIAGSGEDEKVRRIVSENNLTEHIRILGWIDAEEKERYLTKTTFLVLPSHHEAMPMSLLESMSYGCIPIISRVGSVESVVMDRKNGFLMNPNDLLNLEKTMLEALSLSTSERKKISNAAKETISNNYDEKKMIEKLILVYRETIKS